MCNYTNRFIQVLYTLLGYLRSWWWCKNGKYKVTLFHVYHFSLFDFLVTWWFSFTGFQVALIVHDVESLRYKTSAFRRRKMVNNFAEYCFVHSVMAEAELKKLATPKSLTLIPHGHFIETERLAIDKKEARKLLGIPEEKFCPLFFGMIKRDKGLDVLIDAIAPLDDRFLLLIAGRFRGTENNYKYKIDELVKQSRCKAMLRYIPTHEMELWMAAADLLVLPYRQVYQSGVILQAMSRKIPVVVSDLPAFETFKVNETVNVFESGNSKQLADVLKNAPADYVQYVKRADKAFEYIRTAHDWNLVGKKMAAQFSY
jgi:glycosyltransferase involved in cell wall biosynthesis